MRYKISNICLKITSGGTPTRKVSEYYKDGSINWVKTQELNDSKIYNTSEHISLKGLNNSSAKLLPKNTIIVAMYGATAGKLGVLMVEAATNQACANLVINPQIALYQYVFYYLLQNRNSILNLAIGAAQQNLSLETIKNYEIEIPEMNVQQHIVNNL